MCMIYDGLFMMNGEKVYTPNMKKILHNHTIILMIMHLKLHDFLLIFYKSCLTP